jgi:anti-sigma factor ChrR (cupin superfamily)
VAHPRKEVLTALAAMIDGQVHGEEAIGLILHLATCPRCREVVSEVVLSSRDVLLDDQDDDSPLE